MPKGKELTDFERGEIIGLFKGKFSVRQIAEILNHPKSTVGNIIKKYKDQGLTTTAIHSGRPKILSERDERHLIKRQKKIEKILLKKLTEKFNTIMKISVSSRTIQRTLYKAGYS